MATSQAEVIDYIKNLRLSEVKSLIEALENELGVKASAPVMMGGGAGPAAAPAEPVVEQTEFKVILKEFGAKKLDVIKAIREITGLGLKEAKDLVEGAPQTVKEGIEKAAATEIAKKLTDAGAVAEIK